MLQAVMRKVQISRQLKTTSGIKRRLGERFNKWFNMNRTSACYYLRWPRSAFYEVTFTSQWSWQQGIHLVLLTIQQQVRSVRQGCAAVNNANGRHAKYWLCDFHNLGFGACSNITEWKNCNRLEKIHINVKWTFLFQYSTVCAFFFFFFFFLCFFFLLLRQYNVFHLLYMIKMLTYISSGGSRGGSGGGWANLPFITNYFIFMVNF